MVCTCNLFRRVTTQSLLRCPSVYFATFDPQTKDSAVVAVTESGKAALLRASCALHEGVDASLLGQCEKFRWSRRAGVSTQKWRNSFGADELILTRVQANKVNPMPQHKARSSLTRTHNAREITLAIDCLTVQFKFQALNVGVPKGSRLVVLLQRTVADYDTARKGFQSMGTSRSSTPRGI
jgi:hypothetical protein